MLKDLVLRNRSYRRFHQEERIAPETLRELVDLARLCPSAANLQPLKYLLSWEPSRNALIFRHLRWAAYLKGWPGPAEGERPSAYIVVLHDRRIAAAPGVDHGFAAQTMLLGAVEKGLGGCVIGSLDREGLRRDLGLPAPFDILLVLALGKPAEKVVLEPLPASGCVEYWRDADGVHHVPKRALADVIVEP